MEVPPMKPYVHDREVLNSSFGSSLSSTPPWQFSTPSREVSGGSFSSMGVGGPQTSISNDGILYRPLAGHDFLHDIFFGSTPLTELDAPAEDIFEPSQRASLVPDFSADENYPILSIPHVMVASVWVQDISYLTVTLFKTKREREIVAFDYSNGNILYNPRADHDSLSDMPTRSFKYFESCPPLTPASVDISKGALNSSLSLYSHPMGDSRYFVSSDTSPLSYSVPLSTSSSLLTTPVQKVSSQKVPERSATLHRVQSSSTRATKQEIILPQFEVDHIVAGVHKCTIPGCKSESGFRRLDHLKRHQKACHDKKMLKCMYCQKILFQGHRSDNYQQHVYLHATPDRKGKRTKFDVEVAVWEEAKARSRQGQSPECLDPMRIVREKATIFPNDPWSGIQHEERQYGQCQVGLDG